QEIQRGRGEAKSQIAQATTEKPDAIADAGPPAATPPKESLCLRSVHEVIDHVAATKQHRDANQHRNEKRHDRSPFVVVLRRQRDDSISVSPGAKFLAQGSVEHSR